MFVESKPVMNFSEENLYALIHRVLSQQLSSPRLVKLNKSKDENLKCFVHSYNDKYTELKRIVNRVIDMGAMTFDWTEENHDRIKRVYERLAKAKKKVMQFGFHRLELEVIDASRTAQGMSNLMYEKRVTSDDFHQIVAGLARWQVLDEIQYHLRPMDFSSCFAGFKRRGRPTENLYDGVDKERLCETLEALHQEKYQLSVTEGWTVSKEGTKDFLLAFMLSLFKNPLIEVGGKIAEFGRFFKQNCGYGFTSTKNLQNWFKGYAAFNVERSRSQKEKPDWMRRLRKYTFIEALVEWMQNLLPLYGIRPA